MVETSTIDILSPNPRLDVSSTKSTTSTVPTLSTLSTPSLHTTPSQSLSNSHDFQNDKVLDDQSTLKLDQKSIDILSSTRHLLAPKTSVSSSLSRNIHDRPDDTLLSDKLIIVLTVGMLHRDDIYRQAKRLGAKLIFVNTSIVEWAIDYAYDWIILTDPTNIDAVSLALETYFSKHSTYTLQSIDGIITFDEYAVVCAAQLAHRFQLPGGHPDVMNEIKNKYTFRQACQQANVPSPRVLHITQSLLSEGVYDTLLETFPFPCVLKPTSGAGSQFVRRVNSIPDLKEHVLSSRRAATESGLSSLWSSSNNVDGADNAFMIEEMLIGSEVDIDILVNNGVIEFYCISDNFPSEGPEDLFMESGGCCPSNLPLDAQDAIEQTVRQTITHFGTKLTGCFHFEIIVSYKEGKYIAYPVELNLRLGGSEVLVLVLSAYDVHLGIQALKIACGISLQTANLPLPYHTTERLRLSKNVDKDVDTTATPTMTSSPATYRMHACSVNYLAPDSGYVTSCGFLPQASENESFAGCMTRVVSGSPLKAPPLAFDFIGWAVATGSTFENAFLNLQHFSSMFFCDITPFERDDPLGIVPGTQMYYKDYLQLKQKEKEEKKKKKECDLETVIMGEEGKGKGKDTLQPFVPKDTQAPNTQALKRERTLDVQRNQTPSIEQSKDGKIVTSIATTYNDSTDFSDSTDLSDFTEANKKMKTHIDKSTRRITIVSMDMDTQSQSPQPSTSSSSTLKLNPNGDKIFTFSGDVNDNNLRQLFTLENKATCPSPCYCSKNGQLCLCMECYCSRNKNHVSDDDSNGADNNINIKMDENTNKSQPKALIQNDSWRKVYSFDYVINLLQNKF